MSASGLVIMSCGLNAQANILPLPILPDAITSVYNTHFTYTSHPKETLLSSAFYPLPKALGNSLFYSLPENSGRAREGFKIPPSPALGRATSPLKGEVNQSYSGLTGVSRSDKTADSFNLDPRIRSEDDKLISEKQGENKLIQLEDNGHGAPGGNEVDNGNQDDYELDNAERCKKEGYNKTSCLPGETAENFCLYDSSYFEKCVCPDGYKTCTPPYYGIGTACGNKYASCEKDIERACKELNSNYTNTCGAGQQLSSDRCSYDSSYGTCCNTCAGYDNTSIPDGYVQDGEACVDCNGQTKYKIKINPCDGFLDCGSMGPVPLKLAPTAIINPAANQATTGTVPIKPAPPSAQAPINIPVPAPVMPAVRARPVITNTSLANAKADTNGRKAFAQNAQLHTNTPAPVLIR